MAFSESLKSTVRRKAHFQCCLCKQLGVEIHHIIPQEENGPDTEDNAAPLCPSCHETYGANPQKRKFIREARDLWFEICEKRYALDSEQLAEMQRMLVNIDSFVRSSNYPLLPFAMFYTLRHTTTSKAIDRAFKAAKGYKSLKNDLLQLTGTVRLGGYGVYNAIDFEPKESHCTLDDQARSAFIEEQGYIGESAIKNPNDTKLEFFFGEPEESSEASLTLNKVFNGSGKPHDVKNLELFDDTIFQDAFVTTWEVRNPTRRAWSINDLQGARVRLTLEMFSFDNVNFERPPCFHNLHFYFGRNIPHVLYFTAKQLQIPKISKESQIPIKMDFSAMGIDASPLTMVYEFRIDDEMFCNQLRQVG